MSYGVYVVLFAFGAVIGSFINVVIYRLPRELSIVSPRSQCPSCKKAIFWYQNIPIVSYLLLRGRCSDCSALISWKYPVVELLCGIFSIALIPSNFTMEGLLYYVIFFSTSCVFLAHFVIDLEFKVLPDSLNLYLAIMFLLYSILHYGWIHWVLGGGIGFLIPFSVTWIFYKLRGKIGLGGGDIKLFGALGILLGPVGIIHNIFLSCLMGAVLGIILILAKKMSKDNPIPFGPFIILAATMQIYFPWMVAPLFQR